MLKAFLNHRWKDCVALEAPLGFALCFKSLHGGIALFCRTTGSPELGGSHKDDLEAQSRVQVLCPRRCLSGVH